jgi:hypothetical protein
MTTMRGRHDAYFNVTKFRWQKQHLRGIKKARCRAAG